MSKIDYIIGESNTEKTGKQIAFILADELANQKTLMEARIVILEALPAPTPEEQAELLELQLSVESIPDKVWNERFVSPSEGEFPFLNILLVNNPIEALSGAESQTDIARYVCEYISETKSKLDDPGDVKASQLLQRCLMIVRHIIMYSGYDTLDFAPGFIGMVLANNLQIFKPENGINKGYQISGQLGINVKIMETQNALTGIPLLESATTHLLYETGKGYFYEIINT